MRPHRRKAAVPVDTARAPRRAEVRRSGSGLAAARKESPPSPVVGWDGGERRKRCRGCWCGRVATRTAARVVPSLVSGTNRVSGGCLRVSAKRENPSRDGPGRRCELKPVKLFFFYFAWPAGPYIAEINKSYADLVLPPNSSKILFPS